MKRIIKTLTLLLAVVFTFTACNKNVIAEVHPESAIENTATAAGNAVAENNSSSTAEVPAVNNAVPENQTNNAPAQGTENANNQVPAVTNNGNIVPVDSVEDVDGAVIASAYGTVAEHVAAGFSFGVHLVGRLLRKQDDQRGKNQDDRGNLVHTFQSM